MRTNIEINDALLKEAMELADTRTKKATIEKALETLINELKRKRILSMKGKIKWEGNLDEMRSF